MTQIEEQQQKIQKLREAQKIILNEHDILLTPEYEKAYFDAMNSLRILINMEINTLEKLEK